jgi:hypothetical protein
MLGVEMKLVQRLGMENKNSKRARKLSRHWKNCCAFGGNTYSCALSPRKYSYSQRFGCHWLTSLGPRGPANKKVADWQSDGLRMRTLLDNAISTIAKVFGSFSLTYELGLDAPPRKTTHSTLFCAAAERTSRKVEHSQLIIIHLNPH